jgi:cation:H+ antiporter
VSLLALLVGFAAILGGAFLFTNAVEWAGHRLDLGAGAVGTILAAVSTALPESIIPIVAVIRGGPESDDVAIGAIVGAPFMLATIALALVGVAAFAFGERREQGRTLRAHRPTLKRDLTYFLVLLTAALLLGVSGSRGLHLVAAPLFVLAYGVYVGLSLRGGGEKQSHDELPELIVDPSKKDPPANWMVGVQFVGGLALIIGGAHIFVEGLIAIAERLDVSPLVLSLLLAPLATELPEKANSLLWIREGKDSLALGNITGAMVFQSTIPVAIGVAFTAWDFDRFAALAAALALIGGVVALWSLHVRRRFTLAAIVAWAALFALFALSVVVGS